MHFRGSWHGIIRLILIILMMKYFKQPENPGNHATDIHVLSS
jgi:hypothetical protein